jgi:hypothetical protein
MILDNHGNAVASFDDEISARAGMHAIVAVEPECADSLILMTFDEEGLPVGDAHTFAETPPGVCLEPSSFIQVARSASLVKSELRRYVHQPFVAWRTQTESDTRHGVVV